MLANLLLITALSIPTPTLVLRSGHKMDVDGSVQVDQGRVTFRSNGALYSLAESEVDVEATRAAGKMPPAVKADTTARLKVSDAERTRLLKELEQNHSGKPAPVTAPAPLVVEAPPALTEQPSSDEWSWRQQAQAHEETIRRAREDLDLLTAKAESLKAHISGLISLGYKPRQFTYDSTELQYTLEQIPRAELEVTRAERAYAQFRENARKMGVLPGWLR
jgi:hypothetical protein